MDVRANLLQQIKDKAVVHGRVTLSSGLEADYYVDLRRITLDGAAAPLVGQVMLDLTADLDYDAVGGLTLGADPVATSMLHAAAARSRTGRVRRPQGRQGARDAAPCRGPGRQGPPRAGGGGHLHHRRLPLTAVEAVREAGAEVVAVATIVDRATGAGEKIAGTAGVPYRYAYALDELGLA